MLQKKHPDLSPTEFILPPKSAFRGICFAVRVSIELLSALEFDFDSSINIGISIIVIHLIAL